VNNFKSKIKHATLWSLISQILYILIILFTNIILTKYLSPEEFGQISIIMFFVIISSVLVEGGFGGALVRKKVIGHYDYSTVLVFSFIFSIILCLLLFSFSNIIANYYDNPELSKYIKISSIILIVNSLQTVSSAKLIREMKFKERGISRLLSILIASIACVLLAYKGYGVWSFIVMQLSYSVLFALLLFAYTGRIRSVYFSQSSFKKLYSFGVNTSIASLLNSVFDNIYQVIIGKYFGMNQTGLFYQSKRLQDVPNNLINMLLQGVFFSTLSKLQDNIPKMHYLYLKVTKHVSVFMGVVIVFVFIFAEKLISILYGVEWVEGAYFLQILSVISFFYIQELVVRALLKTLNKTKQILYFDLVKKGIQILFILIALKLNNINYLIWGYLFTSVISYINYLILSDKLIGENKRLSEITTIFIVASVIGFILFFIKINYISNSILLFIIFSVFVVAYFYCLSVFKVFKFKSEIKLYISK
jgi:O-antigen/teichoic acid export membrane protein